MSDQIPNPAELRKLFDAVEDTFRRMGEQVALMVMHMGDVPGLVDAAERILQEPAAAKWANDVYWCEPWEIDAKLNMPVRRVDQTVFGAFVIEIPGGKFRWAVTQRGDELTGPLFGDADTVEEAKAAADRRLRCE